MVEIPSLKALRVVEVLEAVEVLGAVEVPEAVEVLGAVIVPEAVEEMLHKSEVLALPNHPKSKALSTCWSKVHYSLRVHLEIYRFAQTTSGSNG